MSKRKELSGRNKVVITVALDPDVLRELNKKAREIGTSRSTFVNRLLFSYLIGSKGGSRL